MPLGSSSAAPVMRPGPRTASQWRLCGTAAAVHKRAICRRRRRPGFSLAIRGGRTVARYRRASIPHRSDGRDCIVRNGASLPFHATAHSSPRPSTAGRRVRLCGRPACPPHGRAVSLSETADPCSAMSSARSRSMAFTSTFPKQRRHFAHHDRVRPERLQSPVPIPRVHLARAITRSTSEISSSTISGMRSGWRGTLPASRPCFMRS